MRQFDQDSLLGQSGDDADGDVSLVDVVRLSYPHAYTAEAGRLRFSANGQDRVVVDGFASPAIRVIDVTNPASPVEVLGTVGSGFGGYAVSFRAHGSGLRTYLAFTSATAYS